MWPELALRPGMTMSTLPPCTHTSLLALHAGCGQRADRRCTPNASFASLPKALPQWDTVSLPVDTASSLLCLYLILSCRFLLFSVLFSLGRSFNQTRRKDSRNWCFRAGAPLALFGLLNFGGQNHKWKWKWMLKLRCRNFGPRWSWSSGKQSG